MEIAHQSSKWETWLNFPFYEEKCIIHPKKYNTVYCGACTERPVCTRCWKSNQHHAHHQPVLQVRVASNRAAIDVKDIREFLDISEIQVYKINYKNIVFLNPHGQGASKEDPKIPTCLTCSRRLMKFDDDNHYKFCCIACKIGSKEGHTKKIEEEMIVRERPRIILKLKLKLKRKNEECSSSSSSAPSPSLSLSLRKRSRKGIPQRAPLQ